MIITNFYRGQTNKLSGFTFDTQTATYKYWEVAADKWTITAPLGHAFPKDNFALPGHLVYAYGTKYCLLNQLKKLKELGFAEDRTMKLSFDACSGISHPFEEK